MKSLILVLSLTFSFGCNATLDRAVKIVWEDVYHAQCKPPEVVTEIPLTFSQNYQVNDPCLGYYHGQCVIGYYIPSQDVAHILVNEGQHLHSGALAHELNHARIACEGRLRGDMRAYGDPNHEDESWNTLVPKANKALEKDGWF